MFFATAKWRVKKTAMSASQPDSKAIAIILDPTHLIGGRAATGGSDENVLGTLNGGPCGLTSRACGPWVETPAAFAASACGATMPSWT